MRLLTLPIARRASYRPRLEALEERCVPSAGDLDTTFGSGGFVATQIGVRCSANDVAIQSDGKIIAVGGTHSSGGRSDNPDFAVARYTTSGALDTTFGSGGTVTTGWGKKSDEASAVAIQSDGKIVVAGSSNNDFALVRYNTNGTLDKNFGSSGKQVTDLGSGSDGITALAVQADGKILSAGFGSATSSGPVYLSLM